MDTGFFDLEKDRRRSEADKRVLLFASSSVRLSLLS